MGDYISREAVLKAYEDEQNRCGPWRFEALIGSVPSATVREDVQGKLYQVYRASDILNEDGTITSERTFVSYKCSICGTCVGERAVNFCPNCGARMMEEIND